MSGDLDLCWEWVCGHLLGRVGGLCWGQGSWSSAPDLKHLLPPRGVSGETSSEKSPWRSSLKLLTPQATGGWLGHPSFPFLPQA